MTAKIAAAEPAAIEAEFENDFPDLRKISFELKRIQRWLTAKFPDDWSG